MSTLFQEEISTQSVPPLFQKLLHIFSHQERVILHGGIARFLLLLILKQKGEIIDQRRFSQEEHIKDVDLIVLHEKSLEKEKKALLNRFSMLQELCEHLDIDLLPDNVLCRRIGKDIDPHLALSLESLFPVVQNNDITINQVVALPLKDSWSIIYTDHCLRDTLLSVGMPYPQERNIHYIHGHSILNHYGIFRLCKFWVEGKVEKIWLPWWMMDMHKASCKASWDRHDLPKGSYLGRYSLVLAHKYKEADPIIQERWMKALKYFGLTQEKTFSEFFAHETALFDAFDAKEEGREQFQFSERTFEDIIDTHIRRQRARAFRKIQQKEQMRSCSHSFQTHAVPCSFACKVRECKECGRISLPRGYEIPCNKIFKESIWKKDQRSLHPFPS